MNKNQAICAQNAVTVANTLESLGFTINREKSAMIPPQRIVFFVFFDWFCEISGLFDRRKGVEDFLFGKTFAGKWCYHCETLGIIYWAASSESVSSSIPSWQILTAHAQPFRGARDLVFCLKVPLDSLLVRASSEGSGKTARMRRLAWTFAARIGDKYQIRLTRPYWSCY